MKSVGKASRDRELYDRWCIRSTDTLNRDILARHRNAHQLDDVRKSAVQSSKAMFRACIQCATARVKCSGSTPCERCGIKELECQYPVQNKKRPKSRKRFQTRETFRTNEGHQMPGDETTINDLNTSEHPLVRSWPVPQSAMACSEIGIYQMQNHQSRQTSTLGDGQLMAEPSFINDEFNVGQTYVQVSQAEQLRAWMRGSTHQQSIERFEPDVEAFPIAFPCDFSTSTTQAFVNINLDHSSMNRLSPPGTNDNHFSFEAQRYDDAAFGDAVGVSAATLPFGQEALFITEAPPTNQQHEIYQRHENRAIVQISSPVIIQSPNGFTSSPGKHHSPATSISPTLGSVYSPGVARSLHIPSRIECENHLTVQIPHQMESAPPPRLHPHSPSTSINPSSTSVYYSNGTSTIQSQYATHRQGRPSWDGTRFTTIPSPRVPPTPSRQFQIPISIEKQVYE